MYSIYGVHMPWHLCGSQRTFWSQFSPSTERVSELKLKVISLGSKRFYPLSHLACPTLHLSFYFTLKDNLVYSNNKQICNKIKSAPLTVLFHA